MRRIPKKPKGKGKRWPKGHSSSSNPETKTFREAAKSRFFRHETGGPSALTVGALKTLDAFNSKKHGLSLTAKREETEDGTSVDSWASSKTFKTFASDWSNCTNVSFTKLLNNFQPKSFLHKEMLAVLAAVTEVIKSNDGKETSTEYFGALLTTLGVTEEEESVAAILSLLSMGIKAVPSDVLRLKFGDCSKIFMDLLAKYSEVENPVILRAVIGCLSVVLRAQDPDVWSNSSTLEVFHSILVFSTHSKPRVRKASQHAVCAILKASFLFNPGEIHPAAATAAKFCIQQIENCSALGGNTTVLHILTLLKEIISTFPRAYIKSTSETLLKLITLGTAIVTTCSLEVLHGLFVSSPPPSRLDPILNAQIVNALYHYQPSQSDPQATVAWMTVLQEAHKLLARSDPALCGENLVKFFTVATGLWLCDSGDIVRGATSCLRAAALDCIGAFKRRTQICRTIFGIVESCLKYEFNRAWVHVFSVLGALFEVIGKDGEGYMRDCLKTLGDLREPHNFVYVTELDYTIGKAIRFLGPEAVLRSIPLVITGNETNHEFRTTWMLPVLKDNVQSSTLKFFIDYFLPMASVCEKKSKELNAKNDKIGAHSYDLLQLQIWALLPPFCSDAPDVKEHFRTIAKILGDIISGRKHLRIHAMAALRKLITSSRGKEDLESIRELSRFSKNYLPILFNLYVTNPTGTDESGERLAAYDTIKVYLTITDPEICGDLFDRALKRIEETDQGELFGREAIMDLLKLLLPYQNEERLAVTYERCIKTLRTTKSMKEGKKYYRLLEVIISSDSEKCRKFTKSKRKEIIAFLMKSIKNPKAMNRGARLRCIFYMMKALPKGQSKVLTAFVPEAVICCKDINQKTRTFAFRLLNEILVVTKSWTTKPYEDVVRDYFAVLFGGLAGTPTLVSATILALSKLTQTLKTEIPSDMATATLENICLLSCLPTREIVGSALGYLKVFLTSFPKDAVLPHVPTMVKAVVSMTEDCRNHFRLKTRDILDRLIRKFSYEVIQQLVPAEDAIMQRRLKNLKRVNAKKKAKKAESAEEDEMNEIEEFAARAQPKSIEDILASSDESEEEAEPDRQRAKRKDKSEMFIQEDADNIVDFISPTSSGKISAAKPLKKKEKKESDFKLTPDGRMIIADVGDEEDSDDLDEDDSDLDRLSEKLDDVAIGRKRKMSSSTDVPAKYQAGGSGIHRPIRQPRERDSGKSSSSKRRKKQKQEEIQSLKTGEEYRAKKAKGDMKLRGRPDPYAYIPLSRKLLNRRKKVNNIVKSAIRGAKIGSKLKMKKKK